MSLGQLGSLVVSLEANMASFQNDLQRASSVARESMEKIESVAGLATKALGILGVAASMEIFKERIEEAAHMQAELKQLSEQTNSTVESLSGIQQVAKLSGTDMESVASAVNKMSKNMAEGGAASDAAFKALGISGKEMADGMKDPASMLLTVAQHLDEFKDSASKTAVEMAIFGKSGAQLGPLLHDLAEQGQLISKVTTEQAIAADELEKNMTRWKMASESLYNSLASYFVPKMNDVLEGMIKVRNESGLLAAAFYGLGGAIVATFGGETNNIKKLDSEIKGLLKTLGEQMAAMRGKEKVGSGIGFIDDWLWGTSGDVEATRAKLKSLMAERAKLMQGAADKNTAATDKKPELPAGLTGDTSKIDAAIKKSQNFIDQLGKQDMAIGTSAYQQKIYESEQIASTMKASGVNEAAILKFLQLAERKSHKLQQNLDAQKALEEAEKIHASSIDGLIESMNKKDFYDTGKVDDYINSQQELNSSFAFETSLIGKTAAEQQQMTAARQIDMAVVKLSKDLGAEATNDLIVRAGKEKDAINASIGSRLAAERSWQTGAKLAINDYIENTASAANQTRNVMTNAFKGMEDALVNFVKTGKLDFKSLADSIITDLIRIQIKQAMVGMVSGAGGWLSTIAGAFGGGSAGASGGNAAQGFNVVASAKGNVFDSSGLSAYSGQIVSSPTVFPFAKGAGLMGEAGPEAIMPLKRGPDGSLGVQSSGGGGSTYNVSVSVDASGGKVQGDAGQASELGRRIESAVRSVLLTEKRPGGLLAA